MQRFSSLPTATELILLRFRNLNKQASGDQHAQILRRVGSTPHRAHNAMKVSAAFFFLANSDRTYLLQFLRRNLNKQASGGQHAQILRCVRSMPQWAHNAMKVSAAFFFLANSHRSHLLRFLRRNLNKQASGGLHCGYNAMKVNFFVFLP